MNIDLMTRKELKKLLKISDSSIRRWIKAGLIPTEVLPGRWQRSEVEAAILRQKLPNPFTDKNHR